MLSARVLIFWCGLKAISIRRFAEIVRGEEHGFASDAELRGFATDNREITPGDLFLAIKGARVDGHAFVQDAMKAGAIGALVERPVDCPHILVENLVDSLADLATHFRSSFVGPVIGITGSAGKTTTKEFVAAALSSLGQVVKTRGNRNTEYTAPLLWAEVGEQTRAVVVEMAMRGFGQIAHLASFSQPNTGIVTNIGYSHLEQVGSREGIAQAKGELLEALPADGKALLWAEDEYLGTLLGKANCQALTFGFSGNADCHISMSRPLSWSRSLLEGHCHGAKWETEIPAVGRHIALGAAAAVLAASVAGVNASQAAAAVASAELPPMRMQVVEMNGASVLLDTYNAAPPSMVAAIETFSELPADGRKFAVIGEMRELGAYADEEHRRIGIVLAQAGLDEVMFYGGHTALSAEEARMRGTVVHEARSLDEVRAFLEKLQRGDAVLIKGSRSLELEHALPDEVLN